ncbi:MAG: peptide chain release factor 2 [Oscillospiraceae bacterium]|nr:peptide chain release factor 2 [Oscillospiraceae bacterium]MDD7429571.1 peptide chain release factor 2 [Oscillospiraceae bacterium]MDY2847924.1 peptide chain release factor 2 [Oscillospiraceae bacterium]
MLLLDELRIELEGYHKDMKELYNILDIDKCNKEIEELQAESAKDGFWDDLENSQKTMQRIKQNEATVASYKKLETLLDDTLTMIELTIEAGDDEDEAAVSEIRGEAEKFKSELETIKLTTLLTGEYDSKNAILTFHAGAGGTEAQDWAEMLFRMYNHWAERHDYKVTTLDYLEGEEAGLKSASLLVEGINAYGFLKSEAGVHRLVRISPFDASGRRHTSFASLEVMPEMGDADLNVEIRPEDLEIDFYRASGAGGQKVNKTSSAVRLTHKPTGIVVSCQTQRSQYQNKDYAMKMLISKLVEIKEREHLDKIEDIKGVQKEIAWGAQIRSYVFMPYTLVKDHRTNFENGNIGAVMDGDIDGFINAYLTALSHGEINN